jgi:hydroxymethylglutaryl-CoA reductase
MLRPLDRKYKESLIHRLERLTPESKPRWGKMSGADLIPHLAVVMRYSMAQHEPAYAGNWFTRHVVRRIMMSGLASFPKGVKVKLPDPRQEPVRDIAGLSGLVDEFLDALDAGKLGTNPHPFFGEIGADGWARFHRKHFEHHLKQFGL